MTKHYPLRNGAVKCNGAPAKVVALKLRTTPRHVYNIRNGECGTTWPTFLAASMHYAEARDFVGRCLGFNPADPRTNQTLEQIRRLVSTLPEEGDQAQPEADGPEEGDQA